MQTPMMSCHIIPMSHEWNANANNIMMTWFTLYANPSDVTLSMHDMCTMPYVKLVHLSNQVSWHASLPKLSENNCFTFSGTKYLKHKWEHAKHDSHCISQ